MDQDRKIHASSLVVEDLRKMASLMKKVDKKLSALGLKGVGQASSSGDDDQLSSENKDAKEGVG